MTELGYHDLLAGLRQRAAALPALLSRGDGGLLATSGAPYAPRHTGNSLRVQHGGMGVCAASGTFAAAESAPGRRAAPLRSSKLRRDLLCGRLCPC